VNVKVTLSHVRKTLDKRVYTNGERNKQRTPCLISGFRREVGVNFALLGCYAGSSGNSLPTSRENLSAHHQGSQIQEGILTEVSRQPIGSIFRVMNQRRYSCPLKMGPIGCPETSVRNYHYYLRNNPEECNSLQTILSAQGTYCASRTISQIEKSTNNLVTTLLL
jgi:hypothetical protein